MHPIAQKYLRKSAQPNFLCPGCGHGTVLNAFLNAVDEMGIFEDLALVSGIGCSAWVPVFINTDVLHTLHGRAIAVATGLKLAAPHRKVVVFTGDGDCLSIGGNHLIHGARRNIDITVIMMNNGIYGMTGGQVAPTTPLQARTQTSPYGNLEPPINACNLALSCGATYVARWTSAHPRPLARAFSEGIKHEGFAFIEVIDQCPTQSGRYIYGTDRPADLLQHIKEASIPVAKAGKINPEELKGRIVVGLLHEDRTKPEFTRRVYTQIQQMEEKKA